MFLRTVPVGLLAAGIATIVCAEAPVPPAPAPRGALTAVLLESLEPPSLRDLATETLERNPGIARARQRAAAAAARAPQARALPDPVAGVTLFALPPETRVGPQRLSASIRQTLPWFGKLALREQIALFHAAAAEAEIEAERLRVLTEVRRLFCELAFLDRHETIVRGERGSLERYEQVAQARYAAGTGLQQEILRIQAQITRIDTRLLEIAERRASLLAALNALRDRPPMAAVEDLALPAPRSLDLARETLNRWAREGRPELAAAAARIAALDTGVELAAKNFRPDVTVGLAYTLVESREDAAGRASPPEGNGDDIFAFTGSVALPVRRRKLEAAVEEATAARQAAVEDERALAASIESAIGDLTARLPLLAEHWSLLENVLRVQAREALRSAETAYSTGKLNAIDLLDAEVVLFEVRIAAERTRADHAVAVARLEHAVARALISTDEELDHER